MSYTLKDRQEIAQDGGAGPDDSPATPEQSLADLFKGGSGVTVNVVIAERIVRIYSEDYESELLSCAASHATPEAIYLAGKAWRLAYARGQASGEANKQHEIRRALGL